MPQLIYKKFFLMDEGDVGPNLTIDKAYDIVCAYECGDDVDLVIVDDTNEHHTFGLNCTKFKLEDHFDLIGDYTEVWENV